MARGWFRLTLALTFAVCSLAAKAPVSPAPPPQPFADEIARMSDDEKVAQLMVVGFSGTAMNEELEDLVTRWHVGALALFSRNVKSPEQVRKLTKQIMAAAPGNTPPPFIAIDQEGGLVVRLRQGVSVLPSAMALGATRSRTLAYLSGRAVGSDLRTLGISMNFAPVLDVNSNPSNPVIGTRSFGERPEMVGEIGRWLIKGQTEAGVISVAKHFPGHGDTQLDSHYAMPSLPHDLVRMNKLELVPFKAAIASGLDAIMTAHIALPKIAETAETPATLSRKVLTEVLRKDLGFDGLIITDGLEMRGIVEGEGIGRAAVMAMNAGADMVMVLWSQRDRDDVFAALKAALLDGSLSRERIDTSLARILRAKHQVGVYDGRFGGELTGYGAQRVLHDQVAEEIAERAVTLVRDRAGVVPVTKKRGRVLFLGPEGVLAQAFMPPASAGQPPVSTPEGLVVMPGLPTKEQRARLIIDAIARSSDATVIVAAAANRYHMDVIQKVRESVPALPMVLVSLGSPYYLQMLPNVDAYLCAYGDLPSSQRAVAKVLLGERGTVGRLPVTIPGLANYGDGLVVGADASDEVSTGSMSGVFDGSGVAAGFGESKKVPRKPK